MSSDFVSGHYKVRTIRLEKTVHRIRVMFEWEEEGRAAVDFLTQCGAEGVVETRGMPVGVFLTQAQLDPSQACARCWSDPAAYYPPTRREDLWGRGLPTEPGRPTPEDNLRVAVDTLPDGHPLAHDWINPHAGRDCDSSGCMWCAGGLTCCSRCGAFEGATTTHCPGVEMYRDWGDAVYAGHVDYRDGKWWRVGSPHTPSRGWDLTTGEYL